MLPTCPGSKRLGRKSSYPVSGKPQRERLYHLRKTTLLSGLPQRTLMTDFSDTELKARGTLSESTRVIVVTANMAESRVTWDVGRSVGDREMICPPQMPCQGSWAV